MEEIHDLCKKYVIRDYTINDDLSIDVDNSVYLRNLGLTKIPLRFRNVTGNFDCSNNHLTNLEGCPINVINGYFTCSNNNLKNLYNSPKIVGYHFGCSNNELISLESFNSIVGVNDKSTLHIAKNPIYDIYRIFNDPSKIELFNDYDCIREIDGKPAVILDRLNDFLQEIGKFKIYNLKEYMII
jgi:hypothetical protein